MVYHHLAPCDLGQIAASGQCFRMEARAEGWWRICAGARCVRVRQEGDMVYHHLAPCDLGQIAASGQCFRMEARAEGWWRICAGARCVRVRQEGERLAFDTSEEEYQAFWRGYFDWDTDYAAMCAAVPEEDAFLRAATGYGSGLRILRQDFWETLITFVISQNNNIPRIQRTVELLCKGWGEQRVDSAGGLRILRQDFWETLITFVISQNNNIPRIQRTVELLCKGWGEQRVDSAGEPYYTFPTKAQLAAADLPALRAIGLGYRDQYIFAIAHSDFDAEAVCRLPLEQAHDALLALPGVGPKVAACVQLFGLHDLAAFPVDTWIRKMVVQHYGGSFPLARYEGFAGVMQQYIFFYGRSAQK